MRYKTRKLQLLAILEAISKNNMYWSSMKLVREIVSKMPDVPVVNDTEIEKLLLSLPLDTVDATRDELQGQAKVNAVFAHLFQPWQPGVAKVENRGDPAVLRTGQSQERRQAGVQQCQDVAEDDFEVSRRSGGNDRVRQFLLDEASRRNVSFYPGASTCTRHCAASNCASSTCFARHQRPAKPGCSPPWRWFLEANTKSLPDAALVESLDHAAALKSSNRFDIKSCADYGEFVTSLVISSR